MQCGGSWRIWYGVVVRGEEMGWRKELFFQSSICKLLIVNYNIDWEQFDINAFLSSSILVCAEWCSAIHHVMWGKSAADRIAWSDEVFGCCGRRSHNAGVWPLSRCCATSGYVWEYEAASSSKCFSHELVEMLLYFFWPRSQRQGPLNFWTWLGCFPYICCDDFSRAVHLHRVSSR